MILIVGARARLLPQRIDRALPKGSEKVMQPVELSEGGLLLRLPEERDIDAVLRACQDPEIQRWIAVPVPYLHEHAEAWVTGAPAQWATDGELRWAVTDGPSGDFLAALSLHARDDPGFREIGFWTAPWARYRGVTTTAVRLACHWALNRLQLRRIEWLAAVGNEGSRRVAEKTGFTIEGRLRARLLTRGIQEDAWIGGLLPEQQG